jgi:exonuclease III
MSKRGFGGGKWCVARDFNSIMRREDRRGVNDVSGSMVTSEMCQFGEFMEDLELVDLPLLGRRFTWYHPNGRSMSRIDRFLVSEDWLNDWGVCSLWVLPRDISDHCPLILKKDILIGGRGLFASIIIGWSIRIIRR